MGNELLSFGDLIKQGKYTIHSRFSRAINYLGEGGLISVVGEEVSNGPINIVIDNPFLVDVGTLEVTPEWVRLGNEVFILEKQKRYCSELPEIWYDPLKLKRGILLFREFLSLNAPDESLYFIFNEKRNKGSSSAFTDALKFRMIAGYREIVNKNYSRGVALLRGAGYGFTPGGDDFIGGMLGGLYLIQKLTSLDLSGLREIVYYKSLYGNPVSEAFNYCASVGRFFRKQKSLIMAMVQGEEEAIYNNGKKLLSIGATSGADYATGLICALERFLYL
ncbi:MAG: oxamate carbamoyltransferase subunit AllH family protein [Spirochaetota bacterium]